MQDDSVFITQNQKNNFLEKTTSGIPLIDGIELRVRNQAYRFDSQRYSIRVSPRGAGETIARKRTCATDKAYNKQRTLALMNSLISERYHLIIEQLYHQTVIALYKNLAIVHEDKIAVLKQQIGSLAFDLNNLIKAEDKLTNLCSNIISLEKNLALIQRGCNPLSGKKIPLNFQNGIIETFDTTGFISVEYIGDLVKKTTFVLDSTNVYLKRDCLELTLAEDEFKLEMAENRRWISFLEFSYDHGERIQELDRKYEGKEFDLNRAYIMNIGVEIPYITRDRYDINRRKLAFLSDRGNFLEIKQKKVNIIFKYRGRVYEEDWHDITTMANFIPKKTTNVKELFNIQLFQRLALTYNIEPKVLTRYRRKAYVSNCEEYARVTFDRDLRYIPENNYNLVPIADRMVPYDHPLNFDPGCNVILELKCYSTHVPLWMVDLIRTFNLRRRSFSKYVLGAVEALDLYRYADSSAESVFI